MWWLSTTASLASPMSRYGGGATPASASVASVVATQKRIARSGMDKEGNRDSQVTCSAAGLRAPLPHASALLVQPCPRSGARPARRDAGHPHALSAASDRLEALGAQGARLRRRLAAHRARGLRRRRPPLLLLRCLVRLRRRVLLRLLLRRRRLVRAPLLRGARLVRLRPRRRVLRTLPRLLLLLLRLLLLRRWLLLLLGRLVLP